MKKLVLVFTAVVVMPCVLFAKDEAKKSNAKDMMSKALKAQATPSIDQQVDAWVVQHIEKAALKDGELQLLANLFYLLYSLTTTEIQLRSVMTAITAATTSLRNGAQDSLSDGALDQLKGSIDRLKLLLAKSSLQAQVVQHCVGYAGTIEQESFVKSFEASQVIIEQETIAFFKRQAAVLDEALAASAQSLDKNGETFKKLAGFCTALIHDKVPTKSEEQQNKDVAKINYATEVAMIVEEHNEAATKAIAPILSLSDQAREINKNSVAVFYHKLYQAMLKKSLKPVVIFNANGLIEQAQQVEPLPALLK